GAADRVIVFGDAALQDDPTVLAASIEALAAAGVRRLDLITWSPAREGSSHLAVLRDRVRASLPERGLAVIGDPTIARLADRLAREAVGGLGLEAPGATWWWPRATPEAIDDDELVVVAESTAAPALVLRERGVETPLAIAAEEAAGPLFDRLWQAYRV